MMVIEASWLGKPSLIPYDYMIAYCIQNTNRSLQKCRTGKFHHYYRMLFFYLLGAAFIYTYIYLSLSIYLSYLIYSHLIYSCLIYSNLSIYLSTYLSFYLSSIFLSICPSILSIHLYKVLPCCQVTPIGPRETMQVAHIR